MAAILLRDLQDGVIIPLTSEELSIAWVAIPIASISAIIDTVAIYALLKQRNIPLDTFFIISLACGDLIFALLVLVMEIINTVYGGFALGKTGCRSQSNILLISVGASVFSLLAMTAHKFLHIIHEKQVSPNHVMMMILSAWLVPALSIVPFAIAGSETSTALQSNKIWCFTSLTNNTIATILIINSLIGVIVVLIYAHYAIIVKYKKLVSVSSANHEMVDFERLKKERLLIFKSIGISSVFSFTWVFFIVKAIYEGSTRLPVNPFYDNLCFFIGTCSPVLNFFVLYSYDAKFKNNITTVFHFEKRIRQTSTVAPPTPVFSANVIRSGPKDTIVLSQLDTVILSRARDSQSA